MRRISSVLVLLILWAAICAPIVQAAPAASLSWSRYDVDIVVNPDGTLTVTEVQTIRFGGGQSYRKGFAVIPQARGSISDVRVSEGSQVYNRDFSQRPNTFTTSTNDNGELEIVWYFNPTHDSTHTYTLQYTVREGLLYYPKDGYDRLQWKAIAPDHDAPIADSTITVRLPQGAPIIQEPNGSDRIGVADGDPAVGSVDASRTTVTFQSTGTLPPGQGVEIRLDFQHGAVAGQPPAWQQAYDLQQQYAPLIAFISLAVGALIAIGGTLLIVLRWYTKGRDPQTGMAATYVAEPPSDLPPGVVGTLLDERADLQDVLATMIDLARRGYLTMEETQQPGFMGIGAIKDFVFRRVPDANLSNLRPYERLVLDRVVPSDERKLSEMKYKFYQHLSEINSALYVEVEKEGLFPRRPDSVRTRWGCGGAGLIILAIGAGMGVTALLADITFAVIVPFIALAFVGVVAASFSAAMPVKSRLGAEATAGWQAFKRYLSSLERYTKIEEATDQFEKYLPYAIAFGIERSWINRFARVNTVPMPGWYFPYGWGRPYHHGHGQGLPTSSGGAGLGGVPSVQGMSDNLAGSLQNMSTGLTSMLNSAASTFRSVPQSSGRGGGGWGGGGFSGGGGGGGGSRGFG